MTPQELLDEVKGRFVVLYHNNDTALQRLLRQALGKYQDRAGIVLATKYPAGTLMADLPDLFLSVAACHDAAYRFVPVTVDDVVGKLYMPPETAGELTLLWLARLRDWPLDKPLPHGCTGLVGDYLEALIDIPNTARTRDAYHAIDGPAADLPSLQELKSRLAELELAMEENKAILPPMLVVC